MVCYRLIDRLFQLLASSLEVTSFQPYEYISIKVRLCELLVYRFNQQISWILRRSPFRLSTFISALAYPDNVYSLSGLAADFDSVGPAPLAGAGSAIFFLSFWDFSA
jgi:hypothetical protein